MQIQAWMTYDGDGHHEMFEHYMAQKTADWNAKKMDDGAYHSQMCLFYSMLYKPAECKQHAAMVPDGAEANEKAEALVSVARMLIYEKQIPAALEHYTQAYELDPEHEVAIEEAGWCCIELKQYAAAEDWFRKAIVLEDEFVMFHEGLGRSLALQEKYTEAILSFEKAVAIELGRKGDNDAEIYYDLMGQCYAALNDFYRALACYTKSLEADPTYADALNNMATLYYNQEGDVSTAIEFLKKAEAAAIENENTYILQTVYINLARLYDKIKEFDLHAYYKQKLMTVLFGFTIEFDDDEDGEGNEEIDYEEIERLAEEKERKEQEENEHTASPGQVTFIISKTNNGTFQFSLADGKGGTIATSIEYTSKAECEAGIAAARKRHAFQGYNQLSNKKGQEYFELLDGNNCVIARSRFYKKWQQRSAAVKFVTQYAKDAALEDRTE